ncbi:LOW QUALITY PROTEIN: hypothetical protein CVT25_000563 [Psilocybe cyanescens]|uniref:non-specific serine/threonine protein kinase n=1 Tax=Psilocybe cyanescens TaxID=93625 RepID=A0A409WZU4_PSICY|nr:LOW QUALITY PROTEIN: hypothetical protein CVT25_000563 [Psilocybe cyanescens]
MDRKTFGTAQGTLTRITLPRKANMWRLLYIVFDQRVVRHVVHLKPRGSRTASPLGSNGEHLSAGTRTMGVLPIEISLWATFRIGCRFLILTAVYLLWVFSSASGICYALTGSLAMALWALVFVGRLFVCSLISVISCFWDMIIWVDKSVDHVFPWLMQTSSFLISPFTEFQERMNAREREWRNLNCIQRKRSNPRPNFNRPCGHRRATPLFRDQAHEFVHHLYLPEERDDLVRHMHDPRHFNHLKKIGAGAFGSIYLVEHRITGKTMAMKTLLRRENSCEEIGLEIRALIRLQGKAWYPKLLSTFMDPMNFYILMPFYAHGDLYSVMNSCGGCLSRELAKFYLAELIVAVQSLHKAGILHRDIKPDNILFDNREHLIVADFGVAHVFITDDEDIPDEYPLWAKTKTLDNVGFPLLTHSIDNPHTIKGVAGTPFYAAPEVLAGQEYSYGVDYYSLAIVYHEMTGYVPIQCGSCEEGESEPTICLHLGRKDVHLQPTSVSDYGFLCQVGGHSDYLDF